MEKQKITNKIIMDYCQPIRVCCSIFFILVMLCMVTGCKDSTQNNVKGKGLGKENIFVLTNSIRAAIETISHYKILFGHHSVGDNILAGLQALAGEAGVAIRVVPLDDDSVSIEEPAFYHFYPGRNTRPKTKIDSFVRFFDDSKIGIDIAFMKFCFVDFTPDSDAEHIFEYYKQNIEQLQKKYPGVTFVHCTVPLTARSEAFTDRIKHLLGMEVWGDASNEVRERYNKLLLKEFFPENIFDLARIESTRLDGERVTFTGGEETVYALAPEYTNDGGHLNELGRKVVASALTEFLAKVVDSRIH